MATNYDAILEEEKKKLEEPKQKQIDAVNKTHDSRASTVKTQYDKAVNDTKIGYESNYERNAVQKLINEKAIAEKNANLGLTDSGLNRTQQTAVQLSYANQKGDIDLAKQKALDTLSTNLATKLSNIEQSRIGDIAEIEASYDAQAQSNAVSRYNSTISSGSRGYAGGGREVVIQYKSPTQEQMQAGLDAYNEGGEEALKAYIDSLPSDVNATEIELYVLGDIEQGGTTKGYGILPFALRTWTIIDDGGVNWFGGVDNNAIVKDQYENEYTLGELKEIDPDLAKKLSGLEKDAKYIP